MIPATNESGLLGVLAQPRENWSARSAARQEELQLQNILTTQKTQAVAEEMAAAAALEQQLAAERALPFFGKDLQNLSAHVKNDERQVFERLRNNYSGDARRWFAAEGQSWMAGAAARLQQAPWYQKAVQNRASVLAAKQAIEKGEYVVGTAATDGYRSGEQNLQDFLEGKADTFNYKGAYKPEDDLKELREMFAPGRYEHERVAVSEEEKIAHLINKYGQEGGADRYYRQHKNVPTYFRSSGLNGAIKFGQDNARFGMEQGRFGMEQGRFRMQEEDQSRERQLFGLQKQGLQLSNAKKAQDLTGGGGENGMPFDYSLFANPDTKVALKNDATGNKRFSNGVDFSKVTTLAGATLQGNGDEILARHLGLQRTKDGYVGRFKDGYIPSNGGHVVNLEKSNYTIQGLESKVYYDPKDLGTNSNERKPLKGYAKVTLKFSTPYDAEKAGVYDPNRVWGGTKPTSIFDSETRAGVGTYDPETQTATMFVDASDIRGVNLQKALQKSQMGTKESNESFNAPYMPSSLR